MTARIPAVSARPTRNQAITTTRSRLSLLAVLASGLAAAGCGGQSGFAGEVTTICQEQARPDVDCGCIAQTLDQEFPDHLKPAFVALRWPLRPDPEDREAVNGAMLRAAGIDPADRQAMDAARREFSDAYRPLRDQLRAQCGGDL